MAHTKAQHSTRLPILFYGALIALFIGACASSQKMKSGRLQMTENATMIEMVGKNYVALVEKSSGSMRLLNRSGVSYTQFPLTAQFQSNVTELLNTEIQYEIDRAQISLKYFRDGVPIQKAEITFNDLGFDIRFGIKFPTEATDGLHCFKNGAVGFDSSNWRQRFSPEADLYYSQAPLIDMRAERDNQWIFCPAPLNISFQTSAGWFSVGLAALAPISRYGWRAAAIWMDYPWQKIGRPIDEYFWTPPLVFTFNESEWEAVADYRHYLETRHYLESAPAVRDTPTWWSQPILSTRGEQLALKMTPKDANFNSEWLKAYITKQTAQYKGTRFTIIIENQWQEAFGEGKPGKRFADLKALIQWCHQQGHKVLLYWRCWTADANTLAQKMEIVDGDLVDPSHPDFENYVKKCCSLMLSNADTALNADGLKLADAFRVRLAENANYHAADKGMGVAELHHYLNTFYQQAKAIKPDAFILGSAANPHFQKLQDALSLNEDWDDKWRREKRALIITKALPGALIVGDAAEMFTRLAPYHYITSAIYGLPMIEYLTQFHDQPIPPEMVTLVQKMLQLYGQKGAGQPVFQDYGWWQWKNGNNLVAESIAKGTALLFYQGNSSGTLLSTLDQDVPFLLEKSRLIGASDEQGQRVEFEEISKDIFKLRNVKKNQFYKLKFRKTGE
ncbi:hypothetical protein L0128_05180 [candidate division KSB1 bacterium]|nr:hypothetical protein [candidate division KSB1 bacterium]